MNFDWLHVGVVLFLLGGAGLAVLTLLLPIFFAPKTRGGFHNEPYECGMPPHGGAWARVGVSFYLYTLIFLAFDVDVLYLFPVAAAYIKTTGWFPFIEIFVFVAVLGLAGLYFYRKGVFVWPRKIKL